MNKFMTYWVALLSLTFSLSAMAEELSAKEQKRINQDVQAMVVFLDLQPAQSEKIITLKQELLKNNKQALKQHGKGSEALKKARRANTRHYQKQLYKVVPQKDVKKFLKANKKKNA